MMLTPALARAALDPDSFYTDASGFLGTTSAGGLQLNSTPTLIQMGAGISAGYFVAGPVFLGVCTDFRYVGQYSNVDPSVGNFRATRWNPISPMIGGKIGKLIVKADVQFLGSYILLNQDSGGAAISYTGPFGARIVGLYPVYAHLMAGLLFESVSFGTIDSSATGSKSLSSKLTVNQLGLTIAYAF
jgi:hypothetical protein